MLETTDRFCLLGVTVNYNAQYTVAIRDIELKARKSMHSLEAILYRHFMSMDTRLYFFNTKMVPVMTFGAEMWAADKYPELCTLYLRTIKQLMGLKVSTSTAMVLLETGMLPFNYHCEMKVVGYWARLVAAPRPLDCA